jgi:Patatin-like phospholipase
VTDRDPSLLTRTVLACALALLSTGCVTLPRARFTAAQQAGAQPAGFAHIRYTTDDPALIDMLRQAIRTGPPGQVDLLAISGGGANGAYGAGLLYAWSKSGHEPDFRLITGVSTGALAAPLAFVGPAWDEKLRTAYANPKVQRLLRSRGLYGLLTPGFYSRGPLEDLVKGYVTDDLIRAVAAEHQKGRRLLVATTDLDTEQLVIWDMGAIAARGGPEARNLFAAVLVASASVPGVFPPAMIPVEGGGHGFAEMSVDAQTQSAFFAVPESALLGDPAPGLRDRVNLFVLINGHIDRLFAVTPRATLPVLARAFDVANKASIRSVLLETAQFCLTHGCTLQVSALPASVEDKPLDFGLHHVRDLFAAGVTAEQSGDAWKK